MPLGGREINLVMKAQDEASAEIAAVGGATQGLGTSAGFAGYQLFAASLLANKFGQSLVKIGDKALGLAKSSAEMAFNFDHEMALVQTQAQLAQHDFENLKNSALDVSTKYGVAASEIAQGLYDIFSTTKDTTHILDLQFQMLRKSGGTYGELVSAFGNVISASSSMNQKLGTAAGSIAFLTLRGRTQAAASISVSRALDQVSKSADKFPKVLHMSVYKSNGDFKQLGDIITEMGQKMDGMSSKQRMKTFSDLFGQGSIQANRFFRLAVPQFKELGQSIDGMSKKDISGQLKKAFDAVKKNDPTYVMKRLTTAFHNFEISIVETLEPAIRTVVGWFQKAVDWLNNLSPSTKKAIGMFVIIGGIIAVVVGHILLLIGAVLGIASLFTFLSGAAGGGVVAIMGSIAGAILPVIAVIAALAAIGYLVIKNWDKVKAAIMPIIHAVVNFIMQEWQKLVDWWNSWGPKIIEAAQKVVQWFIDFFVMLWNNWGQRIISIALAVWDFIKSAISGALQFIRGIIEVVTSLINTDWKGFWQGIRDILSGIWKVIWGIVKNAVKIVWQIIKAGFTLVWRLIVNIWHGVWGATKKIWDAILRFIGSLPRMILHFFVGAAKWLLQIGKDILHGLWEGAKFVWNSVATWMGDLPTHVKNFFTGAINWLLQAGKDIITGLIHGLEAAWGGVASWMADHTALIAKLKGPKEKDLKLLYDNGKAVITGFQQGMEEQWKEVDHYLKTRGPEISARKHFQGMAMRVRDVHLHIEPRHATVDGPEVVREIDWQRRTRGW